MSEPTAGALAKRLHELRSLLFTSKDPWNPEWMEELRKAAAVLERVDKYVPRSLIEAGAPRADEVDDNLCSICRRTILETIPRYGNEEVRQCQSCGHIEAGAPRAESGVETRKPAGDKSPPPGAKPGPANSCNVPGCEGSGSVEGCDGDSSRPANRLPDLPDSDAKMDPRIAGPDNSCDCGAIGVPEHTPEEHVRGIGAPPPASPAPDDCGCVDRPGGETAPHDKDCHRSTPDLDELAEKVVKEYDAERLTKNDMIY